MVAYSGISAMIRSIKYNRTQAHIKKSPKDATIGGRSKLISKPLHFENKMSRSSYAKFKSKLKKEKRSSIIFQSIIYSSIMIIATIFTLWLVNL